MNTPEILLTAGILCNVLFFAMLIAISEIDRRYCEAQKLHSDRCEALNDQINYVNRHWNLTNDIAHQLHKVLEVELQRKHEAQTKVETLETVAYIYKKDYESKCYSLGATRKLLGNAKAKICDLENKLGI